MARLNEPPVSADTVEILRRKMMRQNRDLAKLNNIRALRIRELENECACMLSENLELRGRILELEKQADDDEARLMADQAVHIKEKLESQLAELAATISGLASEPPRKRHSPPAGGKTTTTRRASFSANRPSPSQRRLRDVAKDIESLGHISETKAYLRRSMNPEQIQALQSEAVTLDSPELGPPPTSEFIDSEPVKVDSPRPPAPIRDLTPSPARKPLPPVVFESPRANDPILGSPSPQKKKTIDMAIRASSSAKPTNKAPPAGSQPLRAGAKRKFGEGDEQKNNVRTAKSSDENVPPRAAADNTTVREKKEGKTMKDLVTVRKEKEGQEKPSSRLGRKPLATKNINQDIISPRKTLKGIGRPGMTPMTSDHPAKPTEGEKGKTKFRPRPFVLLGSNSETELDPLPRVSVPLDLQTLPEPEEVEQIAPSTGDLPEPQIRLVERAFLSPNSPELLTPALNTARGDTPPPVDISSNGETTRPSRRVRSAVSYAEPNLRDKMRRPTKELFDAVTGEGRYAHRISVHESLPDVDVKRESTSADSLKTIPALQSSCLLGGKAGTATNPTNVDAAESKRRSSSLKTARAVDSLKKGEVEEQQGQEEEDEEEEEEEDGNDASGSMERSTDLYEFPNETPPNEEVGTTRGRRKNSARQIKLPRRFSEAVDSDEEIIPKPTGAARRRSMMV